MRFQEYQDGIDIGRFKHIPEISCYNNNYYVGLKRAGQVKHDLLFAKSDDDVLTDWFILGDESFIYLGEQNHISGRFTRYEHRPT